MRILTTALIILLLIPITDVFSKVENNFQCKKESIVHINKKLDSIITIGSGKLLFTISDRQLDMSTIQSTPCKNFMLLNDDFLPITKYNRNYFGLTFKIKNHLKDSIPIVLEYGYVDFIKVKLTSNLRNEEYENGGKINWSNRNGKVPHYLNLQLLPNEEVQFFVKFNCIWRTPYSIHFNLHNPNLNQYNQISSRFSSHKGLKLNGIFYGILLFATLISFFRCIIEKDRTYLWYSLYILSIVLFYQMKRSSVEYTLFSNYIEEISIYHSTLTNFSIIFYILFIRVFFNFHRTKNGPLVKLMSISIYFFITKSLYTIAKTTFNFDIISISYTLELLEYLFASFGISFMIYIFYYYRKIDYYSLIILGTVSLITLGTFSQWIGGIEQDIQRGENPNFQFLTYFTFLPLTLAQIGILFEVLFFSLGLMYRSRLKLITSNQELIFKNNELNEVKLKVLNSETEKAFIRQQITETELNVLKSQINPHFISNSLNSIKSLVISDQSDKAAEYISEFSHFFRNILNQSNSQFTSLEEELKFCNQYIQLESLRFGNDFDFKLKVDNEVDLGYVKILPVLLQPFIENAIWHGLQSKKGIKKLNINIIKQDDQTIICQIIDNGIGLVASKHLKSKFNKNSKGIIISKKRINFSNLHYQTKFELNIGERKDKSAGTSVEITIKI